MDRCPADLRSSGLAEQVILGALEGGPLMGWDSRGSLSRRIIHRQLERVRSCVFESTQPYLPGCAGSA